MTQLDGLIILLEKLSDQKNYKPLLSSCAQAIRDSIQIKTAQGRDTFGKRFAPYSEPYKRMKAKLGKLGPVNLRLTGKMLSDLAQKQTKDTEVKIFFKTKLSEDKEQWNQYGKVPRHFFDVSVEANANINALIDDFVGRLLK